jgi:N-acetylmuramoyl-L-alanine amidase
MITLAWYFLKVIICSGILCGYYFLALRNKAFHRWNRFYLLAAIVISLLVPIMKINIFSTGEDKGTVVQVLQTISYGDEAVIEYSHNSGFQLSTENIAEGAYLLISAVFLFVFLLSIYKIKRIRKKYPETKIEDVSFINTTEKGTPFSFFKSIFWNQAIDLHSRSGQQIFNHEIAHVKEKHSYDKILMNIVLIFFWINPFFWLMRKELYMIHEFIADKEALEDSDINAFAEMILQTVYPGQHFSSTNNFFYSPIKRRILMLTKHKNPKVNYISRLLVLPLAAIVFFAFTLKVKNNNNNLYDGKTITVVIDAGHGGTDNGAVNDDGIKEKDITLSIAKKIAALNSNKDIKILLSRDNDQTIPIKERVAYAENNKADLFISIHVNASADKQLNGFSVLIDKQNSEQSLALGSSLINALKETYKTEDKIGVRKNGIFVLDQNICPAASSNVDF